MRFNRLSASLLFVVLAGVLGLGLLLNELYQAVEGDTDSSDAASYHAIARPLAQSLGAAPDLDAALAAMLQSTGLELSAVSVSDMPLPPELAVTLQGGQPLLLQADGLPDAHALSVYMAIPGSDQLLIIGGLPVEAPATANGLRILLTLCFYGGLLGMVLLWLGPLIRRLAALRKATQAFGKGDLSQRLRSSGGSYIAAIEADFDHMADRIEGLMADNRLLSRAVSHDLKTPLARLRFGVEMVADSRSESERKKYALRVEQDLDEMESLVSTLLDYARMEDNRPKVSLAAVDLNQHLAQLAASYSDKPEVRFEAAPASATIQADTRYLDMLINNLLRNARQHAQARVSLSVQVDQGEVNVLIEDDGHGIPVAERTYVMEPFYRAKPAGEPVHKGHGMGLAIAQRLAQWHGATLRIGDSASLGGARLTVSFKASR